jgi:hypothetical protein
MLLFVGSAWAQTSTDGLTLLGSSKTYTDDRGSQLTLKSCHTKYQDPVVGFWFQDAGKQQVRFYADARTWDSLKQVLVKARDDWETLTPTTFEQVGEVKGYRIANRLATLRVNIQGATKLQSKELLLSGTGGADKTRHIVIHLNRDDLSNLVEEFTKIDSSFRSATVAPKP